MTATSPAVCAGDDVHELEALAAEVELHAVVERDDGQRGRRKRGLIEDRAHDVDLVVAHQHRARVHVRDDQRAVRAEHFVAFGVVVVPVRVDRVRDRAAAQTRRSPRGTSARTANSPCRRRARRRRRADEHVARHLAAARAAQHVHAGLRALAAVTVGSLGGSCACAAAAHMATIESQRGGCHLIALFPRREPSTVPSGAASRAIRRD